MMKSVLSALRAASIVALVAAAPVAAQAGSVTYEYDDLGRLVKLIYDDGTVIEITYDPAGNRTVRTVAPPA